MKATIQATTTLSAGLSRKETFQAIQDALFAGVFLVAGTIPVVWENVEYTPTLGTQHWVVYMAPRPVLPATMGVQGLTEHRGITQINVRVPISEGPAEAMIQADRLSSYFRRGMTLTSNGVSVRVVGTSRGSMLIDKAWATLPVSVQWRCHSPE